MNTSVATITAELERRGLLERKRNCHPDREIARVAELLGRELPHDLAAFYGQSVARIGDFQSITLHWNDYVGWRSPDEYVTQLVNVDAVPIFYDGCGSVYGLDLTPGVENPAVYFFDHESGFGRADWAAGSSLARFLLLLADQHRSYEEGWPQKWQLKIDPDIERCPRAPAIWGAG